MEGLEKTVDERVSFLKEQINPKNRAIVNRTFEIQIQTLRNADPERVALLVLKKKKQIEATKDVLALEQLYTELDALEWLQRQVIKFIA